MTLPLPAKHWISLLTIYLLLASPPLRALMESGMVSHMLIQMPMLIMLGFYVGTQLPARLRNGLQSCNAAGIPFALMAVLVAAFWMLPRSLDAALNTWHMELVKFLSLPLLLGLPLALSWHQLSSIGRGFIWSNLISMLIVLGWLYTVAPIRICNNYLINQQTILGQSLLLLAAILATFLASTLFFGSKEKTSHYALTQAYET